MPLRHSGTPQKKIMEALRDSSIEDSAIGAIVRAEHADAFGFFGMHETDAGLVVRTFQPEMRKVEVIEVATGDAVAALPKVNEAGVFAGLLPRKGRFRYQLRTTVPLPFADKKNYIALYDEVFYNFEIGRAHV